MKRITSSLLLAVLIGIMALSALAVGEKTTHAAGECTKEQMEQCKKDGKKDCTHSEECKGVHSKGCCTDTKKTEDKGCHSTEKTAKSEYKFSAPKSGCCSGTTTVKPGCCSAATDDKKSTDTPEKDLNIKDDKSTDKK